MRIVKRPYTEITSSFRKMTNLFWNFFFQNFLEVKIYCQCEEFTRAEHLRPEILYTKMQIIIFEMFLL